MKEQVTKAQKADRAQQVNAIRAGDGENRRWILRSQFHESNMKPSLLNPREAAQILRMDSRTLVRWARLGYVPAHPMGEGKRKLWRFLEHELLEWVREQGADNRKRPATSTIDVAIDAHARRIA